MDPYQQALNSFKTLLTSQGKSPSTVASYSRDVKQFLDFLKAHYIPFSQVEALTLNHYQKGLPENRINSIRRAIISIRLFFRHLHTKGTISSNPFEEFQIPSRNEALPNLLTPQQFKDLRKLPDSETLKGSRDAALLDLLGFEGIKVSELIELQWEDFLYESGSLRIQHGRPRVLKLCREATDALQDLHTRAHPQNGWIFRSIKGETLGKTKMSRHGIKFVLYELGQSIKLEHLNAEMLRHNAMNSLLDRGFSVEEIKNHLGLQQIGNIAKHIRKQHSQFFSMDESRTIPSENS